MSIHMSIRRYDFFYHEHFSYYSLIAMRNFVARFDMQVRA